MSNEMTAGAADITAAAGDGVADAVPGQELVEVEESVPSVADGGRGQRGMVSAEWAVGIIAAIAIAGVLLAVVTNGRVERALLSFILMVIEAFARGL